MYHSLSDFLLNATDEEKIAMFTLAAEMANKEQRDIFNQ